MVMFMDERYIFKNLGLFVGVGLFFIAGAVIHSFIVVVMICGWMKGRTLTVVDKTITSLSIARLSFQLTCLINMFLEICYQDGFLFSIVKKCADFTELLSNTCCVCLFTLLTFVVCLKISNIRHAYFQHLKFVLSQRIAHLISAVVVVSILQTVVIRTIIFSFLNFALEVILTLTFVYHYETLGTTFSYVIWNFFPIIHSLYIIYSTAKLRNAFSQILQGGRNCIVKGGHAEPNSNNLVGEGP